MTEAREGKVKLSERKKIKEKLFRNKGINNVGEQVNWRKRRADTAEKREEKLLKQLEEAKIAKLEAKESENTKAPLYSLSIAIPGSFLNNAQSAELRTYMAGQIARAATLFCVDEIIIYDETSKMTKENVDAYYSGSWYGDIMPSDSNFESCFYLGKILEYLECPQYLRKQLFPKQRPLKFAGLLNPLDAHHHLKSDDLSVKYREGIVLNKPMKQGRGPLCDIGLEKEFQIEEEVNLPPGTRVTVEISNLEDANKKFRGNLTSAKKVREASGLYWGYTVKFATSLKDVIDKDKYDVILGTSPRGKSVSDLHISTLNKFRALVVFGGVKGVDAAFEAEEALKYNSAEEAFTFLINTLPNKGSKTERVEENIMVSLSEITMRIEQLS